MTQPAVERVAASSLWATRTQFFFAGFAFATWGVHIPTVKATYGINEATLGLAMLAAGFGALAGVSQAGRLLARFGTRKVANLCGIAYALLLAPLLLMPNYVALLALLALFGVVTSIFDVAINAEGAELERRTSRPLLSGMHGMFSAGGMAGAAIGSAWLAAGGSAQWHLLWVTLAGIATVLWAASHMLAPRTVANTMSGKSRFVLPRGALAVLGLLAALGLIAEGAIYDWSVLYLQNELGSPQQQAALAYASFSGAMALTRFGGDWLRARVAPARLLRASALVAALAMVCVLTTRQPWVALVGFALVGVGFANVVPLLFSAASRVPGTHAADGIAAVSAVAYLGFMAGPPLIGMLANVSSLTAALYLVVGFAVALALFARRAGL
jgi:predicted MFS family arabinose efflux permease